MKSSGCEGDIACLPDESLKDLRVGMTLITSTDSAQGIEVPLAFHIPDIDALASLNANGERRVRLSEVLMLLTN